MSTISGATAAATVGATKKAGILFAWLTALVIGAGCFYIGMAAFAGRVAPAMRIYSYPEGRCTIHFIRPLSPWRRSTLSAPPRYIIFFSFTVHTANNQDYQIVGAGVGSAVVSSSAEMQNMVNNYHQGGNYPCWYNPSDPSRVVLYRSMPILSLAWCSAFAALGLLIMLKALTHIASGTYSTIRVAFLAIMLAYLESRRLEKRKKSRLKTSPLPGESDM